MTADGLLRLLFHQQNHPAVFPIGPDERGGHHPAVNRFSAPVQSRQGDLVKMPLVAERRADRSAQLPGWQTDVEVQEVLPFDLVTAESP